MQFKTFSSALRLTPLILIDFVRLCRYCLNLLAFYSTLMIGDGDNFSSMPEGCLIRLTVVWFADLWHVVFSF